VTLHAIAAQVLRSHRFTGPAVAAGLLLVGGEPGAGLPPTFVEVCRVRPGPLLLGMCRGLRCRRQL